MIFTQDLFWIIIGAGVAIPVTLVLIINLVLKIVAGENYELEVTKLFGMYLIALVGWAIFTVGVIS